VLRISKKKDHIESLRPPEVLEIPGNELRASKKKKKKEAKQNLYVVTWHPARLSREGFQQDPSLPAFGPKGSTWSGRVGRGWGGGVVEGRGERKQKNPLPPIHAFVPIWNDASILGAVQKRLEKKILRAGLMFGCERQCHRVAFDEPLRPRDNGHSTEIRAQMKRNQENIYTKVTTGIFF